MTDIIKLAREAGFHMEVSFSNQWPHVRGYEITDQLKRFAELVAAPLKAENEAQKTLSLIHI